MLKNAILLGAVAAGGALGAVMRYLVSIWSLRALPGGFPWGTLAVNVLGSLVMGVLVAWFAMKSQEHQILRAFVTVGLLGAFTTFSTFSFDAVMLFEKRGLAPAGFYVVTSLVASIGGFLLGLGLGRAVS